MSMVLSILLIITSLLLVLFVLLHRGKGGGLANLFGGGVSSSLGGSAVVEKNLDRLTVLCGAVGAVRLVALGRLLTQTSEPARLDGRRRLTTTSRARAAANDLSERST